MFGSCQCDINVVYIYLDGAGTQARYLAVRACVSAAVRGGARTRTEERAEKAKTQEKEKQEQIRGF